MKIVHDYKAGDRIIVVDLDDYFSPDAKPGMIGTVVSVYGFHNDLGHIEVEFDKCEDWQWDSLKYFVRPRYIEHYNDTPEGDDWI